MKASSRIPAKEAKPKWARVNRSGWRNIIILMTSIPDRMYMNAVSWMATKSGGERKGTFPHM